MYALTIVRWRGYMVCSTIYSLSTPPHRHVREHGDVSHLEGMPQYGGVIFCHSYVLRIILRGVKRQVQRVFIHMRRFRLSWSGFFLDSWIVVILSILEVISSVWGPFCLKLLFSRSVRPLLDNVALVLLSRSYRFSGSKDPPLLEVVFLLPRSYCFLEVKSPIFRNSLLSFFLFVFSS